MNISLKIRFINTSNISQQGEEQYHDVGNVAVPLLRMMGHSGTVPGCILAADLPAAFAKLQLLLISTDPERNNKHDTQPDNDESDTSSIGLSLRAWLLIRLLYAAIEQGCDIMWEESALLV